MKSLPQRQDWNQASAVSAFIRIAEDQPRKDKRSSAAPRQDQFQRSCPQQIFI